MSFSVKLADLPPRRRYKILVGLVVPRPIALITTVDAAGTVNAAPFSFFNVYSEDPPLVVIGLQHHPDGRPKDTTRNIAANGEFVVHLIDEDLVEPMNVCAADFAPEESEIDAAGLKLAPSIDVKPPRIATAPAALECRRHATLVFGPGREILVGEVLRIHIRDGVADPETLAVDLQAYRPVGRLFFDFYCRMRETFAMPRITVEQWRERRR